MIAEDLKLYLCFFTIFRFYFLLCIRILNSKDKLAGGVLEVAPSWWTRNPKVTGMIDCNDVEAHHLTCPDHERQT